MPNNVEKAFQRFVDGLDLPRDSLKVTLEKSEEVIQWLKGKLRVSGTFPGGSYRRGTAIPSDSLRLHLIISPKHFFDCKENSFKMLNFLKNRLSDIYEKTTISDGGQVVRIKTSSAVDLDLVPSIKLTREGYLVPNGHGGWFKTNPGREETVFKAKDEASSGRFKKMVKIIKAWNLHAGCPFNPYFLELVVYYRVNDFTKPYAQLVHSIFESMSLFLPEFLNCPAVGEAVSCGIQAGLRQKVAEEACSLTSKAVSEKDGAKAVHIWKSLLGERFGEGKTLRV